MYSYCRDSGVIKSKIVVRYEKGDNTLRSIACCCVYTVFAAIMSVFAFITLSPPPHSPLPAYKVYENNIHDMMKSFPQQRDRRKKDYERVLTLFGSDSHARDRRAKVTSLLIQSY